MTIERVQYFLSFMGRAIFAAISAAAVFALISAWFAPPRHHSTNVELFKEGAWAFQPNPVLGTIAIPMGHGRGAAGGKVFDHYYGNLSNRLAQPATPDRVAELAAQIVTVGCSQAWGHGVEGPDIVSFVLGRLTGMTSINLGHPGSNTPYAVKRLELLPELNPKVILYIFWGDHIFRNVRLCAPVDNPLCLQRVIAVRRGDGQVQFREPSTEFISGFRHMLMRRWYIEQYNGSGLTSYWKDVGWSLIDIYERMYKSLFDRTDAQFASDRTFLVDAFDYSIRRMAFYAKERKSSLVVVHVPVYSYPNRLETLPADLHQVLTKHDAIVIDMAPKFNATIGSEPKDHGNYSFVIPGDGHLNALGHRMIAEEVLAALHQRQLL